MPDYAIDSGAGTNLRIGLQGYDDARRVAQQLADNRRESVWLYEVTPGDGPVDSEEIMPSVLTGDTITDDQIRNLRAEARTAGDHDQVALCNTALGFRKPEGRPTQHQIDNARAQCAAAINAVRAMETP